MKGPVQVLVVGFDRPDFTGEVLAELARLREAGIVRLVDLLLVAHPEDGALETLPLPDHLGPGLGDLAADLLGAGEGTTASASADAENVAAWSLADVVPVGGAAAVALIEHLWAEPLAAAIRRAGGTPLEETWLAPGDVEALDALDAARGG